MSENKYSFALPTPKKLVAIKKKSKRNNLPIINKFSGDILLNMKNGNEKNEEKNKNITKIINPCSDIQTTQIRRPSASPLEQTIFDNFYTPTKSIPDYSLEVERADNKKLKARIIRYKSMLRNLGDMKINDSKNSNQKNKSRKSSINLDTSDIVSVNYFSLIEKIKNNTISEIFDLIIDELHNTINFDKFSLILYKNFSQEIFDTKKCVKTIAADIGNDNLEILYSDKLPFSYPKFKSRKEIKRGFRSSNYLISPVYSLKDNRLILVIQLENNELHNFKLIDEMVLKSICHIISYRIEIIDLIKENAKLNEFNTSFAKSVADIASKENIIEMLEEIRKKMSDIIGYEDIGTVLYKKNEEELYTIVSNPLFESKTEFISVPSSLGITGDICRNPKTVFVNGKSERFHPDVDNILGKANVKSMVITPIYTSTNKVLGVFQLINKNEGPNNEHEFNKIKNYIRILASLVNNMKQKLVATDILASLMNVLASIKQIFNSFNKDEKNMLDNHLLEIQKVLTSLSCICNDYNRSKPPPKLV